MGIGYSVSCGYLIDNPLENLVYIPSLTRNSIRQQTLEGGDMFGGTATSGSAPFPAQSEAYELHLYDLPSLMNSVAMLRID